MRKEVVIGVLLFLGLSIHIAFIIFPKRKASLQIPDISLEESKKDNVVDVNEESIDAGDYIIPGDEALQNMSRTEWIGVYWKYINRIQTLCRDVVRVGSLKDGGKEICADKPFRPSPPCIVYSFGINFAYDFDQAVVKLFGCQVFAFDPSMNVESKKVSEHIWFYNWGLGGEDTVTGQGWTIKTLATIRRELGHLDKPIDLLKADIEADEWHALLQMLKTGALNDVKQIAVETHFLERGNFPEEGHAQLSALRRLYDAGFRIFMRDRNIIGSRKLNEIDWEMTNLNEISLVNIRFLKAKQ